MTRVLLSKFDCGDVDVIAAECGCVLYAMCWCRVLSAECAVIVPATCGTSSGCKREGWPEFCHVCLRVNKAGGGRAPRHVYPKKGLGRCHDCVSPPEQNQVFA
jgi:hypothetical protein